MTNWLVIGKVVAPQGLHGEVRIYPDSDFPERFLAPGERWIRQNSQADPTAIALVRGRYLEAKNLYVVKFQGVNTRQEAEALRGFQLVIEEGDRPELEPGEFYIMDLIGLEVLEHSSKKTLGIVKRLASAGNDLLEIQLTDEAQTTILVPFVHEFFPKVDLEQGQLELIPMKGLLPEDFIY